jgi:hypothetical protein
MTGPIPLHIEISRIGTIDVVKNLGEIGTRGFQKEVVMVVHQAVGINDRIISLRGGFKI